MPVRMPVRRAPILAAMLLAGGCGTASTPPAPTPAPAMQAFASDEALRAFLAKRADHARRHATTQDDVQFEGAVPPPPMVATPAPAAPMSSPTLDRAASPGITNTQEAGVDEGGIVKVHGNHLVVLRRGRLFTIAVDNGSMRAVDRIDAFPPGTSGRSDWYDEMLVAGDHVVVIGYSYERGGTEINRFRIDRAGRLRFEDSHHLRSDDYYSAGNYASRLIGDRLVFYAPLAIHDGPDMLDTLPGLERWTAAGDRRFRRIVPATRIYVPAPVRRDPTADTGVLHTVTTCDLAAVRLSCAATAVLGSYSRNFYVSGDAVYVWISGALGRDRRVPRALLYRLPLDGGRPGAIQASGGPVDQFSFREDMAGRALDVVVRADSEGDGMWRGEVTAGDAALLRVPLAGFGDGTAVARSRAYRPLPLPPGSNWSFHNRFVGGHLLYAAGGSADATREQALFAVPLAGGPVVRVAVPHAIDRIEVMGDDAVVVGNDAGARLGFTAIGLGPAGTNRESSYFLPAAREGERRSHAFFYRPDPGSVVGASGLLGLPVTRDLGDDRLRRFVGSGSAVAFLRRADRRLSPAGELVARPDDARDDGCRASCVDWYGNARPIFLGDRLFALMGYELVEGRRQDGRIVERARLDFAPAGR